MEYSHFSSFFGRWTVRTTTKSRDENYKWKGKVPEVSLPVLEASS